MITKEQAKTINAWLKNATSPASTGTQREDSRRTKAAMDIMVYICKKLASIPDTAKWPAPPLESWLAFDDSTRTFLLFVAFTALAKQVESLADA